MISTDGSWALSGSWDGTMRLWDLAGRQPTRRFVHHTKDILSVAFSMDNRQIISGGRDKVCPSSCTFKLQFLCCFIGVSTSSIFFLTMMEWDPDHQAVEHPGVLQVHHRQLLNQRGWSQRVGELCALLAICPEPGHRFLRLG